MLWPDVVTDFVGFTWVDVVNRLLTTDRTIPRDGVDDLTTDDIAEVLDAGDQPLDPQRVLDIIEDETNTTVTLSMSTATATEDDSNQDDASPTLTMTKIAELMRIIHSAHDYITEMDPNFL